MRFLKHIWLFMKTDFKQVRRKWLTLPLLLLFPIFLIFLTGFIVVSFFTPDESSSVNVGLVDLDNSRETKMIVKLIGESAQLGSYLHIQPVKETKAKQQIKKNNISAYFVLPASFTENLYHGTPVEIAVIGNPKQPTDSKLVKQLIDSVARHISVSQANILTIDDYAKKIGMSDKDRHTLMFDQFKAFLLYVVGKDKVLSEEKITNQATSSPVTYFGTAGWFIITTVWLVLFFQLLYRQAGKKMKQRMSLYGVSILQQCISRITVTVCTVLAFSLITFVGFAHFIKIDLDFSDYMRIMLIMLLYSICILTLFAVLENICFSEKLALFMQYMVGFIFLAVSGAFIPAMYFSLKLQHWMAYIFSNHAMHWLQEVIINQRVYVDYWPLLWSALAGMILLAASVVWKERIMQ